MGLTGSQPRVIGGPPDEDPGLSPRSRACSISVMLSQLTERDLGMVLISVLCALFGRPDIFFTFSFRLCVYTGSDASDSSRSDAAFKALIAFNAFFRETGRALRRSASRPIISQLLLSFMFCFDSYRVGPDDVHVDPIELCGR